MKRLMSVLFVLTVLLMLAFSVSAFADGSEDYVYSVNSDYSTCTVTYYRGTGGDVVIPASLDGYIVTGIDKSAFSYAPPMTSVTIPVAVTTIDVFAFDGCFDLMNVYVDAQNTAFRSIDGVLFNKNGSALLLYPAGREGTYQIGNSVTSIGDRAFYHCTGLTEITIPNSVTSIGESAFCYCNGLQSVTIPDSVTSIRDTAFRNCWELKSLSLSGSLTSISEHAFSDCWRLTSVTIPGSVTSIGAYAFWQCSDLEAVTIPNSVTSIGERAFSSTQLKSVTIPKSVTAIDVGAFGGCTYMTSFQVDALNPSFSSVNGVLFDKDAKTLIQCPGRWTGSYTVPDGVTAIGDYAFDHCWLLTDVTFSGSVTSVGDYVFRHCSDMTTVTFGEGVASIGEEIFDECSGLTDIYVDEDNTAFASRNGALFDKSVSTLILCPKGKEGTYTIPDSVTTISDMAFYYCTRLTGVTIPYGVTSIGDWAFRYCESLTSVTLPDSVTDLGLWAFDSCGALTSATISRGMTRISERAFEFCDALSCVIIPAEVTGFDDWAFYGCSALADVYYTGTESQWRAINIHYSNQALSSATIHYIDPLSYNRLTLPADLTAIGAEAFADLPNIGAVCIPASVSSIADDAFDEGILFMAPAGSYAITWAADHNFVYIAY